MTTPDPVTAIQEEIGFYDEVEYESEILISGKNLWALLEECKRWRHSHSSPGFNPDWCEAKEALAEHLQNCVRADKPQPTTEARQRALEALDSLCKAKTEVWDQTVTIYDLDGYVRSDIETIRAALQQPQEE